MSPSKRFEETEIVDTKDRTWRCETCKHGFFYDSLDTEDTVKPNFCPKCGRRNSNA